MERGVEEGWLEKWAYESFRDHTKNGRVTVDEIKEAYEWMHEETCNYLVLTDSVALFGPPRVYRNVY